MSGIVGFVVLSGPGVNPGAIERMVGRLARRGPDATGTWSKGAAALGQCQMYTTPESTAERQPYVHGNERLVVVADARIDNRDELIAQLGAGRKPARLVTDVELIAAAYERWGEVCPERLIGDFAFAIWDARAQQLFLARDPIGNRPFYYYNRPGEFFAFGSEIKALFSLEEVPCAINETRVAEYLANVANDPEITFYEDILRLPPATSMIVTRDGTIRRRQYWHLDPERELRLGSDEAYVEGFLDVFTEAVRCRMRSHGAASVMLSGGLDSSSVAGVARKLLQDEGRGPLHTFSAIFPGLPEAELKKADERMHLDALEAQGGLDMHRIPLDEISPLASIDNVIAQLDQPPLICNTYLVRAMHRAAAERGVRVMLDGAEGDIAVSYGLGYLAELTLSGRWGTLYDELSLMAARGGSTAAGLFRSHAARYLPVRALRHPLQYVSRDMRQLASRFVLSRRALLWGYGIKPYLVGAARFIRHGATNGSGADHIHPLMSRDLAERARIYDLLERGRRMRAQPIYSERQRHFQDWVCNSAGIAAIQEETNHLAAMEGIERRHPFYDVRLLAYCLSLPAEQKLRHGWPRWILRKAMESLLPESVQWRPDKADLSPNFLRNLAGMERETLEQVVAAPERIRPYIDMSTLKTAWKQKDAMSLWFALVLDRWLGQVDAVRGEQMRGRHGSANTVYADRCCTLAVT